MTDPVLDALARALESEPANGPLWLRYAELLLAADRRDDALVALRTACELGEVRAQATRMLVPLLRAAGLLAEALIRAEKGLEAGPDASLAEELARIQAARGRADELEPASPASEAPSSGAPAAAISGQDVPAEEWAEQFEWGDLRVTFDDVAGLDEVKRQIRLKIIAPFEKPELYRAFGRQGGGGILLYGPPGCGKSHMARATAGELGARFVTVPIHEIVDKWWGESEKAVHALFEDARASTPTVLFFDEFDALGASRRGDSQFWKTLVDQFLQEMDGLQGRNEGVLLFAATNAPWNVDSAFRRPGRFDRVLFVAPPDAAARRALLERCVRRLPGGAAIPLRRLVARTELFSGADLVHLCERAAEDALEHSLASGEVHDVEAKHFDLALQEVQSTTLEWLADARNHARYANEGRQYDDLVSFLKGAKRW